MRNLSLVLSCMAIFFSAACSGVPTAPTASISNPTASISNAISACENLFDLWEGLDAAAPDANDIPAMLRQPPEEIANVRSWSIDDLGGVQLSLASLKIPNKFRKVWVVEDLDEEDRIFSPTEATELTEILNEREGSASQTDSEDMAVCVFRGLQSVKQCQYKSGLTSLPFDVDSWQQVSYMFAVGLGSHEVTFLGIATGEEAGCPYEIKSNERIVGLPVEARQIENMWNEVKMLDNNMQADGTAEPTFLEVQRLSAFFPSSQRQFLLLIESENNAGKLIPVLVDGSDGFRLVRLGLAGQDLFSSVSIQEVEILDISTWKRNDTQLAIIYTQDTVTVTADLTGRDFRPVSEPVLLLQNDSQSQEPELSLLSATGALQRPTILLDGK